MLKIQLLKKSEIPDVAQIANQCFRGYGSLQGAKKWISCNFAASPRALYFVAKEKDKVLGYILWLEKGGFRKEAVWELEQVAVLPQEQDKGIATKLILESLAIIKKNLERRRARLKLVEVTTGLHQAPRLYQKTLGAKKEAVIKDFFRGDEMIMIARF